MVIVSIPGSNIKWASSDNSSSGSSKWNGSNSCCHNHSWWQQQQKREILRAQSIIDLNIHGTVSENCIRMPLINMASSSGSLASCQPDLLCHLVRWLPAGLRGAMCRASIKRHLQRLFAVRNNLMKYSVCHVSSYVIAADCGAWFVRLIWISTLYFWLAVWLISPMYFHFHFFQMQKRKSHSEQVKALLAGSSCMCWSN